MSSENFLEVETPKIEPLPGFIETRYVKCGRLNCHCARGKGHGPYHYWIHKSGGQKFKKYIKREDFPMFSARIEVRRQRTKKIFELNRMLKLNWQTFKAQMREFKKEYGIR